MTQAQATYKLGLLGGSGKFEFIQERLVYTPPSNKPGSFAVKIEDIDIVTAERFGIFYGRIRIITKKDLVHIIKDITMADAKDGADWILSIISQYNNQETESSDTNNDNSAYKTSSSTNELKTPTPKRKILLRGFIVFIVILGITGGNNDQYNNSGSQETLSKTGNRNTYEYIEVLETKSLPVGKMIKVLALSGAKDEDLSAYCAYRFNDTTHMINFYKSRVLNPSNLIGSCSSADGFVRLK